MPRKTDEAKSHLPAEGGGAAPAPVKRKRTTTRTRKPAVAASRRVEEAVASAAGQDEVQPALAAASMSAISIDSVSVERDEIARLAYRYWESRGGQGGSAEEDWLRAEQEVQNRRAKGAA